MNKKTFCDGQKLEEITLKSLLEEQSLLSKQGGIFMKNN